MIPSSFRPNEFSAFGPFGRETIAKMERSLSNRSLSLSYDQQSKIFTILNSAVLGKEAVQGILSEHTYEVWDPELLDRRDRFGNYLVRLLNLSYQPTYCGFDQRFGEFDEQMRSVFTQEPSTTMVEGPRPNR
jgi:hypothetical protein